MIIADGPEVYGYTIFCDDIRVEVGGKLTYVGVYHGFMFVPTFPVTLPKFAMHIFYCQKQPNVIPAKKLIVVTPGNTEDNPAITMEVPNADEQMAKAQEVADARAKIIGPVPQPYAVIGGPLMLTNFVITEPGEIKVRALRDDVFIRLGSLRVIPPPDLSASSN